MTSCLLLLPQPQRHLLIGMTFSFNAFIVSRGLFGLLLEVRKTRQKAKYAKKETWPVCKYAVRKKSLGQFLGNLLSTGFSTVTNKCHPSPLELPPPPSSLLQSTAWVWSAVQGSGIGILGHFLDVSVLLSFPICLFSYVFFPENYPQHFQWVVVQNDVLVYG